jgi:hypothetical protein
MDRKVLLLAAAAIPLGLAGGYVWSALTAPAPRALVPPKATQVAPPPSPEEIPTVEDRQWSQEADDESGEPTGQLAASSIHYSGCNEVRAAGRAPLYRGNPGYRVEMDGDDDGIACEPIRNR